MKDILPSMPKGEIVGNIAIAQITQTIKVVIDGNRLVMEHKLDDVRGYPRGDVKIGFHSANFSTRGAPITLGYPSAHRVMLFRKKEGINPFEMFQGKRGNKPI